MIITFKRYPELGRLKVVRDEQGFTPCRYCALDKIPCDTVDLHDGCTIKRYHYEPAPPRKGESTC